MSVLYAIPTLNQIDWVLEKHVPSIHLDLVSTVYVHINECVDYKPIVHAAEKLPTDYTKFMWTYNANNLGVAKSWNIFLKTAFEDKNKDGVVIANDDIILGDNTLESMLSKAKEFPDAMISAGPSGSNNAFSLFYLPKSVFTKVGFFDTRFYPAYFEDNDYHRRMNLLGVPLIYSDGDNYYHRGSATINTYTPERMIRHHYDFGENEFRYVQKWGGLPGKETVTEIS
jgi:GT2 family glycosyltransferase